MNTISNPSPFWRFSLAFYSTPGVAPACIELQDQAGVDVNVLLFLLWQATEQRTYDAAAIAEIEGLIGPWRDMAVVPLRAVRRALKSPPPVMAKDVAESFRDRVKAVELEAERLQQEAMTEIGRSRRYGRDAASAEEAARASVAAYQVALRPFPSQAVETILAAFAANFAKSEPSV